METTKLFHFIVQLDSFEFPADEGNNYPIKHFYPGSYPVDSETFVRPESLLYCDTYVAMYYLGMIHQETCPIKHRHIPFEIFDIHEKIAKLIPSNPDYESEVMELLAKRRELLEKEVQVEPPSKRGILVRKIIDQCVLPIVRKCREQNVTPPFTKEMMFSKNRTSMVYVKDASGELIYLPYFKGSNFYEFVDNSDIVELNAFHSGWGLMVLLCSLLVEANELTMYDVRTAFQSFETQYPAFYDVSNIVIETLQNKKDVSELDTLIQSVLAANPKAVSDIKQGKDKAIGALVGQIMKQQKTDPATLKDKILNIINSTS